MTRARDFADVISGNFDIPAGSLTNAVAADGSITTAKLADDAFKAHKNIVINGNMAIAQRGTSSTASGIGCVDRWTHAHAGGTTITTSQESLSSSDTPYSLGLRNYIRMTNNSTTSLANAQRQIYQNIEAQYLANSGWDYTNSSSYVTVSFWVRSSLAGKYGAYLLTYDGTPQQFSFTYTLAANTWTKVTKTIPGNSNLTFDNDNGLGMSLVVFGWLGTDYTDSTATLDAWLDNATNGTKYFPEDLADWAGTSSATLDVTGVQFENGSSDTPFELEDYSTTLLRSQRYYFKSGQQFMSGHSYGVNNSADGLIMPIYWPTTMRKVNPGVTFSGGSDGGSGAALFTAYVQEEGMSVNLRSTNSATNVWWSGFIVSEDSEV
jgi:hypothetical protein